MPYCSLSQLQFGQNVDVAFFSDGINLPDSRLLPMLGLYYDSIIIPHPRELLNPIASFYSRTGFLKHAKRLMKAYFLIKDWVDAGIVKLLVTDSKYVNPLNRSHMIDLRDERYQNFLYKIGKKHGPIYFRPEISRDYRSKWLKEFGNPNDAFIEFLSQSFNYYADWALLVAAICGATPLTNQVISQECLKYKLERTASMDFRLKVPTVLNSILKVVVPYADALDPQEIVELRRKRKTSLYKFRTKLRDITLEIRSSPWDNQFQTEMSQMMMEEILPQVRDIRRQLREFQPDVKTATLKAILSQIPYASVLSDAYEVIQTWRTKRNLEKNSLYFLALL